MSLLAIIAGAGALVALLATAIHMSKLAGEMQAKAEHEAQEREQSERMSQEMLKERTVEDVLRDLDAGEF